MLLSQPFLLCASREHRGTSTQLWKALVLEELSPALRSTNFSCVFTDPEHTVQRHVVLAQCLVRNPRKGFQGQEELCSNAGRGGWAPLKAVSLNDHHLPMSPSLRWKLRRI